MNDKLIERYLKGEATEAEGIEVEAWFEAQGEPLPLPYGGDEKGTAEAQERTLALLQKRIIAQPRVRRLWPRIAAAASILVFLSAGGYLLLRRPAEPPKPEALLPAGNGITLTVAGQKVIPIAYHHQGRITAGAVQQDSLLTYTGDQSVVEQQTLANNSGHRISVQLADGTEAILDVASTLNYPSAFTGRERRVALNGQAYFKVKHDAAHPFFVDYGGQSTEDIGTEFNIHAYAGEPLVTTLVSGSIRVNRVVLQPGEQLADGQVQRADLSAVLSWLQDRMILHGETLENIMRNVARIYRVNVVWQDEASRKLTFGGMVNRATRLSAMLNFMRETGKVDFRVEGKTIYVIKPNKTK